MVPFNAKPRVLVVEDDKVQSQRFMAILSKADIDSTAVADGVEALGNMEQALPDAVLTDLQMPRMDGLKLVCEIRRLFPFVPVVLMTSHGSEQIAAQALRQGAAGYIPKNSSSREFIEMIEEVLESARHRGQRRRLFERLDSSEYQFTLHNDEELIGPLVIFFQEELDRLDLCDENVRIRVGVALREALINASQHGNLEVSSELRQEDENEYHQLVSERIQAAPYCDRRVDVRAHYTRERVRYEISDDGPGFDPRSLPDPTDPSNLERVGGRGLLLIHAFMDEVHHNERGNQIVMIKHRDKPAPEAS